MTSLDGINGPSIQTLLRGENDSKQSDEFQATETGDLLVGNMWLLLRRMKACMDEFQSNTSQAHYFEGSWRITSKTNTKSPIADSSKSAAHVVLTRNAFLPAWPSLSFLPSNPRFFFELYQQIHVCLSLTR